MSRKGSFTEAWTHAVSKHAQGLEVKGLTLEATEDYTLCNSITCLFKTLSAADPGSAHL